MLTNRTFSTKAYDARYFETAEIGSTRLVESVKPFKVRTSCGHIVIRKMRESTAGVPYTEETILDAPNGRACEECEVKR